MKTYTLTLEEVGKAAFSAAQEYNKYKTKSWSSDTHLENFFFGKVGEIGYSKHCGKPVDFTFHEHKGDGGEDFAGVQVKTVTWEGPNKILKVRENDSSLTNDTVSKFVLMYVSPGSGGLESHVVGEISKENFLKKSLIDTKYKTKLYTLNEKDLDTRY